mmetsp:Transcript_23442/g.72096  ORF Transcript_23442/g.72096 Transcript_23442/m.72096 type:complete len:308 (-) Transcript_23442:544-1467(-)
MVVELEGDGDCSTVQATVGGFEGSAVPDEPGGVAPVVIAERVADVREQRARDVVAVVEVPLWIGFVSLEVVVIVLAADAAREHRARVGDLFRRKEVAAVQRRGLVFEVGDVDAGEARERRKESEEFRRTVNDGIGQRRVPEDERDPDGIFKVREFLPFRLFAQMPPVVSEERDERVLRNGVEDAADLTVEKRHGGRVAAAPLSLARRRVRNVRCHGSRTTALVHVRKGGEFRIRHVERQRRCLVWEQLSGCVVFFTDGKQVLRREAPLEMRLAVPDCQEVMMLSSRVLQKFESALRRLSILEVVRGV